MLAIIKKYLKLALIAILIAGGGYYAGWSSKPDKVVTVTKTVETKVTVKDEAYTQQKIDEYKQTHKDEFTVVKHEVKKVLVPCSAPLPDGQSCKPPCATDCSKCPYQVVSDTTDTQEHHNATTTTTDNTTTHTTDTTHTATTDTTNTTTTTTTTKSADSFKDWQMGVRSDITVFNQKLTLDPAYGLTIGYKVLGPFNLNATIYTDKKLVAAASLSFKDWQGEVNAGTKFTNLKPYFGGAIERRILGPVWLGVWGESNMTFGLRASFEVK